MIKSENKYIYKILLVAAVLFNAVPRFVHGIYLWEHRSLYYIGQALSFVLILLSQRYSFTTITDKALYEITLWVAFSNLIDELFFDPVHLNWSEVIIALFMIICTTWRTYKSYGTSTQQE